MAAYTMAIFYAYILAIFCFYLSISFTLVSCEKIKGKSPIRRKCPLFYLNSSDIAELTEPYFLTKRLTAALG